MGIEKIVGIAAGVLTAVSMLPQFFKLIKKKNGKDISVGMLGILLAGVGAWVYYGFLKNDLIIIITNAVSFLISLLTITLAIKYRKR